MRLALKEIEDYANPAHSLTIDAGCHVGRKKLMYDGGTTKFGHLGCFETYDTSYINMCHFS